MSWKLVEAIIEERFNKDLYIVLDLLDVKDTISRLSLNTLISDNIALKSLHNITHTYFLLRLIEYKVCVILNLTFDIHF